MCGIIGFVGSREAQGILIDGLRRLEYRGYDSAGMAVLNGEGIQRSRRVGPVRELEKAVATPLSGHTGIAHTRWATHGKVTEANAHPHMDSRQRVAVVHNGIVENMVQLKQKLTDAGVEFRSETDSEVLAHLISRFYYGENAEEGETPAYVGDPVEAVNEALKHVRGTWGLAVIFEDHANLIVAARNGSPLVVGLSEGETYLASDYTPWFPIRVASSFWKMVTWHELSPLAFRPFEMTAALRTPTCRPWKKHGLTQSGGIFPISCSRKYTSSRMRCETALLVA